MKIDGGIDEPLTVRVLKFDGTEHRVWRAALMRHEGSLMLLYAAFQEEVRHPQLGLIERGTRSIEYYWLDRWYNVFRFQEPDGSLLYFYCNVNMPPQFDGRVLSYVDLDMDIIVAPDLSYELLDLDEFEENRARFRYPAEVQACAQRALYELITLIESRRFPFDESQCRLP